MYDSITHSNMFGYIQKLNNLRCSIIANYHFSGTNVD